jgi:hypothetical protein
MRINQRTQRHSEGCTTGFLRCRERAIDLKSREPFGLAELWDVWRKPDGKRVESFTSSRLNLMSWCGLFTLVVSVAFDIYNVGYAVIAQIP